MDSRSQLKRPQVDDRNCVAFAIGNVSVLTVRRPVVAQIARPKVQPAQAANDRQENNDE